MPSLPLEASDERRLPSATCCLATDKSRTQGAHGRILTFRLNAMCLAPSSRVGSAPSVVASPARSDYPQRRHQRRRRCVAALRLLFHCAIPLFAACSLSQTLSDRTHSHFLIASHSFSGHACRAAVVAIALALQENAGHSRLQELTLRFGSPSADASAIAFGDASLSALGEGSDRLRSLRHEGCDGISMECAQALATGILMAGEALEEIDLGTKIGAAGSKSLRLAVAQRNERKSRDIGLGRRRQPLKLTIRK